MKPLLLLVIFSSIAACAFVAFAALTYVASTPSREDWKKFLGSFAGTALALSVGFISFMLQEQDHVQQKQAEELAQTQRKLTEDTAQMRVRLLYSIAQKKFELPFFLNIGRMQPEAVANICDQSINQQERDERLLHLEPPLDPAGLQLEREIFQKLFSTDAYERNALTRLMKETAFPGRVTQRMLSQFLEGELELYILGPKLLSQVLEFYLIYQSETFCAGVKKVQDDWNNTIRTFMNLQLSTCGAYAVIGLPINESFQRSSSILNIVENFHPGSSEEKASRIQRLLADLAANVGDAKSEFQTCLDFAEIGLQRMPP